MNGFTKRLVVVVVSLFLLGYAVYQGVQMLYNPIETEPVALYSVYDTVEAEGLIVRNETVVTGDVQGHLFYTLDNGSRASKGEIIAQVYASEEDALAQQQLDRLTSEIDQLTTIQAQSQANRTSLDTIDKQIRQLVDAIKQDSAAASMSRMDEWQSQLSALLNKRQVIIGKNSDFSQRLSDLRAQKDALARTFAAAASSVTAPVAGYFVSAVDGFEDAIAYDEVTAATPAAVQAVLAGEPVAAADNVVGKIVGDYDWYLLCVVPAADAVGLGQGATLSVRLPFVSNLSIPATVVAANRDTDGNIAIVLSCSYMSGELSSARREAAQLQLKQFEGLRVPSDCVVRNEEGEQGVYIRVGDTVAFRRIHVLHAEPEYVICEQTDEAGYLKLYDDLIVEGKGLYDGKTVR